MRGELPPPEEITRAVAEELAEPKYRQGEQWWTPILEWLERAWVRFVEWLTAVSDLVGGPVVLALIIGSAVIAASVVVTTHLGRRRARLVDQRIRREHERSRGVDLAQLERQAAEAQAAGDHETAFRLLFQAALVRLDRAGLIDLRPGATSGTLSETLGSKRFQEVVARFDTVVYGDRPARRSDPEAVREMLDELLGVRQ